MSERLYTKRDIQPADLAFIFSTWLNALYYGNRWKKEMDPVHGAPIDIYGEMDERSFYQNYKKVIERVLQKPGVNVRIACLEDDHDAILGYSICEPEILHFIFVKEAWRNIGIAKSLVPEGVKFVTHLTKVGHYANKKHWKYNPFLI